MSKEFKIRLNKNFSKIYSKNIYTKHDIISIILDAIEKFLIGYTETNESDIEVTICVSKMNRMFIELENKIYTFAFPFNWTENTEEGITFSYNDIAIDIQIVYILKGIFNISIQSQHFKEINNFIEESIYEKHMYDIENNDVIENKDVIDDQIRQIWILTNRLLFFEVGYLRFDHDKDRENGKLHPIFHLDINYSTEGAYKLGLDNKISLDTFIDILDVKTECIYLKL